MNSCAATVLEEYLGALAQKIGTQRYKVWFTDLARVELTDSTIAVTVPNSFAGDWITKHYAGLLTRTAQEIVGHPCQLSVSVSSRGNEQSADKSGGKAKAAALPAATKSRPVQSHAARKGQSLRFSLDDFVVGPSNQLAFATAQTIVSHEQVPFNPLFIHGSCGVGKTHLLQGICSAVRISRPGTLCLYISGEEFTNQFILALKQNRVSAFRERFRKMDLLAIDDIHFLANKRATQEEFLHTFNSIETQGKQLILASDTHPKLLGQVIESLVSRFLAGMVVKIEPPDYQTRVAILKRRDQRLGIHTDIAVLEYVAQHVRGNVRELEGAMLKLKAYAELARQPISLSVAAHVLSEHLGTTCGPVDIDKLQKAVAGHFGLSPADLLSSRRNGVLNLARTMAMYLAKQHTGMSYPEIGRAFGRRSHASAISACRKLERLLEDKKILEWTTAGGRCERQDIAEVISALSGRFTKSN